MELHKKSSPDKKEKKVNHKEILNKSSHHRIASCCSLVLLLILSALIALAVSVLYVEVYQLKADFTSDSTIPLEALKDVELNEAVDTIDEKEDTVDVTFNIEKLPEEIITEDLISEDVKIDDHISNQAIEINNIPEEEVSNLVNNHTVEKIAEENEDKSNIQLDNIKDDDNMKENENFNPSVEKLKEKSLDISHLDNSDDKLHSEEKNKDEKVVHDTKLDEIEEQIEVDEDKENLIKLYIEVEGLTDEILSEDPTNDMIKQLAPHLESTLKDIELDRIAGIKQGLLHIRSILTDLKDRILLSKIVAKEAEPLPKRTISDEEDKDGRKPVDEVIPDPIYIAPLEETTQDVIDSSKPAVNDKSKSKVNSENDSIKVILEDLKQELVKNPVQAIKKIDEALLQNPNNVDFLLLKAGALYVLSTERKSNPILEQAINTYQYIVDLAAKNESSVPKDTLKIAGLACAEKMIFRGFQQRAVRLLQQMIQFFPEDITFKNKLGVAFLTFNEVHSAKNVFEESLKLNPDDGFAQVHYGFILKSEGTNLKEAVHFLQIGIRSGVEGTSDGRFYFHLGDALQRLNQSDKAREVYKEGAEKGLFLNPWQRSLYNVDRLRSQPLWTHEETTYAQFFKKLENNWKKIKLEGLAALSLNEGLGFKPETENLKDTGDWRQFELFVQGRKNSRNCVKAPITCSLVEQFLPAAGCKRGQVKFSVMQPDTHVWPHTGPTNCRLRAHLGLVVPDGAKMRVGEETLVWREGKVIVFDDSWEHEVWHRGSSPRLILIVDVWHPELSEGERKSLSPI